MPAFANYIGLYQTLLAVVTMTMAGRVLCGGRGNSAVHCMVGWGALCLLLTAWGVVTTTSLRVPAVCFIILALAGVAVGREHWRDDLKEAACALVIAAPCLWIMGDMAPSQIDTLAVILPNAGYLYDHAAFPSIAGPPSFSELPVAPYNTEFVSFLGSLFGGGFAANTPALFTVVLHVVGGLLFARALAGDKRPGWRMTALGIALATFVDPGFMPRVAFSGYGESPLAITLLFAGWLGAGLMTQLAAGDRPVRVLPLAAVLVAMVNAKQQAVGLFLATVVGLFVVAASDPRIGWRAAFRTIVLAAIPGAALYLAWAAYVHHTFPQGELAPRPITAWPWASLPQILLEMARELVRKGYYLASLIALAWVAWRGRAAIGPTTRYTVLSAGAVFVLYTGFLVATYLGWFNGEHSYFRYNSQLSLLIVLALVLAARDKLALIDIPPRLAAAGGVVIAAVMVGPLAWPHPLRFDRIMPQPWLEDAAAHLAHAVKDDDRIAVVLPGDANKSIQRGLSAFLRYAAPRRPDLDLRVTNSTDPSELTKAAADGYRLAFLSCTDAWGPGLPPHAAALLGWTEGGWQPLHIWPYPPAPADHRGGWTYLLANKPLCL